MYMPKDNTCCNLWNKIRYSAMSCCYDRAMGHFGEVRNHAIEMLHINEHENVLIVGAGTGADLEFLPRVAHYQAIDITNAMLQQCAIKANHLGLDMTCTVMDAQNLTFPNNSFDAVILNLIIAVVPDPIATIREVQRVLKPGGRIVIFDKFLADDAQSSCCRSFINCFTSCLATSINRRLGDILHGTQLTTTNVEPVAGYGDMYKIITLRNDKGPEADFVESIAVASSSQFPIPQKMKF